MGIQTGLLWRALVMCVCGCAASVASAADLYQIDLSPPMKVGRKYHLVSKATSLRNQNLQVKGAQLPWKDGITYELDGIVTVFGVDSKGSANWTAVKVKSLHMVAPSGETEDVVPPGSVIQYKILPLTATTYQTYVQLNGKEMDEFMVERIKLVFQSKMPEAPTEQEMFGSGSPQPVGGGWALNRERGVKYMAAKFMGVEPADFTGKTHFIGIEKVGNVDCYHLEGSVKAAKYVNIYDANIHTQHAAYNMKFEKWVPKEKMTFEKSITEQHFDFAERGVKNGFGFRQEVVEDLKQEVLIEPIEAAK